MKSVKVKGMNGKTYVTWYNTHPVMAALAVVYAPDKEYIHRVYYTRPGGNCLILNYWDWIARPTADDLGHIQINAPSSLVRAMSGSRSLMDRVFDSCLERFCAFTSLLPEDLPAELTIK